MTEQENRQAVKSGYNAIAEQYYEAYVSDKSDLIYLDAFIELLPHNSHVLDVGCGMGHYSKYVSDKGVKVTGVDFSEGMLKIAKEKYPEIEFINADICDLKGKLEGIYDGIVIAFVFHHLSKDEVEKCLKELKRLCKSATKLIIFVPEGTKTYIQEEPFNTQYKYKINEYAKEELTDLLNKHGFKVDKIMNKATIDDPYTVLENDTMVIYAEKKGESK